MSAEVRIARRSGAMELDGRSALVTGASGGLGRHIARALADAGVTVGLAGRKNGSLAALADQLRARGARVRAIRVDMPEIIVTPYPVRPLLAFAALAPRTAERLAALLGMTRFARAAAHAEGRL